MKALSDPETDVDVHEIRHRIRELETASRPLEPEAEHREHLRNAVVASSERFLRSLGTLKAYEDAEDPGVGLLSLPIAEHGVPIEAAIDLLERDVIRPGAHPASGGHVAYLSGGGIYHSALADYLAAVTNKFAGLFFTGPGPVRMENMLVRWVADLVGYPTGAGGWIASGGSLANLAAVTAARDAHRLRAADFSSAVVYSTHQTHHSIEKALRVAGLGEALLRDVPVDERYRMRPEALSEAIASDRRQGLKPWLIVATAGSTDTGAVDPLDELATVAERERCWLHVDAAYGGFFLLTEHGKEVMKGIERCDSVVLDPHKGLFLPWGTGVLVVRDVGTLTAAHQATGSYLQDAVSETFDMSPADVSPELTKPFRALRMWLPLVLMGTKPFAAALEEKLLLARYLHRELAALGFEVAAPQLSILTFRWAPPGVSSERADQVNQAILEALRRDGRLFLSSTTLDGRFTLRMAVLAHRTHLSTIDLALQILREQTVDLES